MKVETKLDLTDENLFFGIVQVFVDNGLAPSGKYSMVKLDLLVDVDEATGAEKAAALVLTADVETEG